MTMKELEKSNAIENCQVQYREAVNQVSVIEKNLSAMQTRAAELSGRIKEIDRAKTELETQKAGAMRAYASGQVSEAKVRELSAAIRSLEDEFMNLRELSDAIGKRLQEGPAKLAEAKKDIIQARRNLLEAVYHETKEDIKTLVVNFVEGDKLARLQSLGSLTNRSQDQVSQDLFGPVFYDRLAATAKNIQRELGLDD